MVLRRRTALNLVFFINGIVLDFTFVVGMSAAKDVVEDSNIPVAAVLLTATIPLCLLKLILPYHLHHISYAQRIVLIVLWAVVSLQLMAWFNDAWVRMLAGILIMSLSTSLAELSYFALASRYPPYHKSSVIALSAGTGVSGIVGSGSYLVFRQAFGYSSRTTLACFAIVPPLLLVLYYAVLSPVPPLRRVVLSVAADADADADAENEEDDEEQQQQQQQSPPPIPAPNDDDTARLLSVASPASSTLPPALTTQERLAFVRKHMLWQYMGPLFVVYFAEYFINQSLNAYISFNHGGGITRTRAAQYTLFYFVYNIGVCMSRASAYFFRIRRIWLLALLQLFNVLVFTLQLYTQFITNIWLFCALVLYEGCLGGATFSNAFYRMADEIKRADLKEFALTCASAADASGVTLAAIVGLCVASQFKTQQQHDI